MIDQQRGQGLECHVTADLARAVVYVFEPVDVDQQQASAIGPGQRGFKISVEPASIEEPGQGILLAGLLQPQPQVRHHRDPGLHETPGQPQRQAVGDHEAQVPKRPGQRQGR